MNHPIGTCAVSYMRCSGEGQTTGDTWDRQSAAIAKYAGANQITVLEEFRDAGVTGKMELEGRDGLSRCLAFVRENNVPLVLVESSDRLARDMIVAEVIVREFQKIGLRVVAASGGIDLTEGDDRNPTAKLVRQILAAVSEFDRCVIVLKTRAARQRVRMRDGEAKGYLGDEALAKGRCEGRKPYGALPSETEVLTLIRRLRIDGAKLREIVDYLNERSIMARSGKVWTVGSLARILAR